MKQRGWGWLALMVAALAVAGCSRPLKDQLVGRWEPVNGQGEITFLKDGTATLSHGPLQVSGNYTTPDEQHVKVEPSGLAGHLAGTQVWPARIDKGRLTLTINGKPTEFARREAHGK